MEIKVIKTTHPAEKPDSSTLGFGKVFTDHMFIMDYSEEEGWHDARIVPFGPIALHPASTVLHYGVEIFEGLKAYRRADGKVQLFRPIENIRRMNRSAERLCLPQIPDGNILPAQESAPAMLVALEAGKCDAVVTDMPTGKAACVAYPDFKLLDFTGTDGEFEVSDEDINIGISVQKGNTELLDALNSVLDKMTEDDYTKMMDEAISVQPLSSES